MTNTTHVEDFRRYLTDERHSPVNTISSYIRDISQFVFFLEDDGDIELTRATTDDVQSFITNLEDAGKSPATISRCIASLKTYYGHLSAIDRKSVV